MPRTDAFSTGFYQEFWEIVKYDLLWVFNDIFRGNANFKRINYAYIVLISKMEGANLVTQFRLVSLLNCSFKIFMKILANRLWNVISHLIGKVQYGFVKDRFILENAAQEVLSETYFNKGEFLS